MKNTRFNSNHLSNNGLDTEQQAALYLFQLEDIYNRPRWYLDNLEYLSEYRVSWINYKQVKITPLYKKRKSI